MLKTKPNGRQLQEMREIVVGSPTTPPSGEDYIRGRQPKEISEIVAGSPTTSPSAGGINVNVVGIKV